MGWGVAMLTFARALAGRYVEGHEGHGRVEYALLLVFTAILVIMVLVCLRQFAQASPAA